MTKTRKIVAAIAALTLGFSSVAGAAGFATWPSTRHDGSRGYAYWGPNGLHWGRVGAGHFGHHSYKYPRSGGYYGCKNCYRGYYDPYYYDRDRYDHYDRYDDHDSDKALWYGLGLMTPLLLDNLYGYDRY